MPDAHLILLVVAALLPLADLLLTGGAMTMAGISAVTSGGGPPAGGHLARGPSRRARPAPRRADVTVLEQSVRARLDPDGHQAVDVIVDGGYHPDAIIARAGLPLRIVFIRDDGDACSERVIFSSPHIERRLTPIGATTIELPAQPPGEIRFTCGFGRYRGRIELIPERAPSLILRLRSRVSRLHARA